MFWCLVVLFGLCVGFCWLLLITVFILGDFSYLRYWCVMATCLCLVLRMCVDFACGRWLGWFVC